MKMRYLKFSLVLSLALSVGVALEVQAQQRSGGFGGGARPGGFGGGAGGGSSGSGQSYNPNGSVGSAMISIDPDTRNITVIADEATMKHVSQVISNLDYARPQVLIKVVFLEVQHTDGSDIGFEGGWGGKVASGSTTMQGAFANGFGMSGISAAAGSNAPPVNMLQQPTSSFLPMPPGAGMYQLLAKDFQATLRAIAQAGKASILSRPSILARDSQPAQIVIGQSVPLITSVSYNALTGNPINSVTYTEVGIILKVTPFITGNGMVQMWVQPQTSSIDPTTTVPISTGVSAPVIDVRSADTVVVTPDSQTVVIGGLISKDKTSTESKIPFLGDIPFLGNLFKRTVKSEVKNELLIFLTPHIVRAPALLVALGAKERTQSLAPDSDSERDLNRFLDMIPEKKSDADKKKK